MSNVNVFTGSLNTVGTTPSLAKYDQDITIQWVDESGRPREVVENVKWPDVLDEVDPELVEEVIRELLFRSLRNKAQVDRKPTVIEPRPIGV